MNTKRFSIYTDGASRGNPGPAAIGAVIKDETNRTIAAISRYLGSTTNNQAEYRAIIAALEKAIGLGAREVRSYADSELLVKQVNGQYRIRNAGLRPLYLEIVKLVGSLEKFSITYIPREKNTEADALANKALDASRKSQ